MLVRINFSCGWGEEPSETKFPTFVQVFVSAQINAINGCWFIYEFGPLNELLVSFLTSVFPVYKCTICFQVVRILKSVWQGISQDFKIPCWGVSFCLDSIRSETNIRGRLCLEEEKSLTYKSIWVHLIYKCIQVCLLCLMSSQLSIL